MRVFLEPSSDPNRQQIDELYVDNSDMMLVDYKHPKITSSLYYAEFTATLTPEESGNYDFSLAVAGTAKLYIDDEIIIDNETKQTAGPSFFGLGTVEEVGSRILEAGRSYNIMVKFGTYPTSMVKKSGGLEVRLLIQFISWILANQVSVWRWWLQNRGLSEDGSKNRD